MPSKKSVYISSGNIETAKVIAAEFVAAGNRVVSTWHGSDQHPTDEIARTNAADLNVTQITEEAEVLVLDCPGHLVPGGCYVEAGVALGAGIPVVAINVSGDGEKRRNLMLHHPSVVAASGVADAIHVAEELDLHNEWDFDDDDSLDDLDLDDEEDFDDDEFDDEEEDDALDD